MKRVNKILLPSLFAVLLLAGLGCNSEVVPVRDVEVQEEEVSFIEYELYSDPENLYQFEVPKGVSVSNELNGFEGNHKFVYQGKGYVISFNEFKKEVSFEAWESLPENEVIITKVEDKTIYVEAQKPHGEVFYSERDPGVSFSVTSQDGEELDSSVSLEFDEVFIHLLESLVFEESQVFPMDK